mmetsp:Transcript_94082/g.302754  ORF Transcript_94082/g.302754 Transcript_94082/m.302754 type:complete len:692 (+) Transcript_94082:131-2206(+)
MAELGVPMRIALPHGSLLKDKELPPPALAAASGEAARPGFEAGTADEFLDAPGALAQKVAALAELVRGARHCVAYTGAGISTAAGIGDYATKAHASITPDLKKDQQEWPDLLPTRAHFVLTAMHREGLLHGWVQQNHDGLPQKAGLPQSAINEIHGSWFDPSNPTVGFGGALREDLFAELLASELRCDVCLALGTSLCNTPSTADRVALAPALRSAGALPGPRGQGPSGLVIVALQRTRLDHLAAIRIYAPLDETLAALAEALHLDVDTCAPHDAAAAAGPDGEGGSCEVRVGDEAVIACGPDRGTPVRVGTRTCSGDWELQLGPVGGAPRRRALLGRWWCGGPTPRQTPLLPAGSSVPAVPSLANLLPKLPPQAAMMLGLPPGARVQGESPVAGGLAEVLAALEGLWDGSAASADASPSRPAQPMRLVLAGAEGAEAGAQGARLFGAGYSAWPAAAATGAAGCTFFVVQGDCRSDGRVRLRQFWECCHGSGDQGSSCEYLGQLVRQPDGGAIRLAGAWLQDGGVGGPRSGAFVWERRAACWAGRWAPEPPRRSHRLALSVVPPLLFGAALPEASSEEGGRPRLLRGSFSPRSPDMAEGLAMPFELWEHRVLPPGGSSTPPDSWIAAQRRSCDVRAVHGTLQCHRPSGLSILLGADSVELMLTGQPLPAIDVRTSQDELGQALRLFSRKPR